MIKKRIAILGSTGSIGKQTLEVIDAYPAHFEVEILTAQNNSELLIEQAKKYQPNAVVIGNELLYEKVFQALDPLKIKVYSGEKSLASIVQSESIDLVVTALVGYSGLLPTIKAIEVGKTIALANKETLVVAGDLITDLAKKNRVSILPIDSEHSAIFQCWMGEFHNPIEKIILTASGGPFRGKKKHDLEKITKKEALKHPNWSMGAKITIDSATLMNKGLEVIEAQWLFQLRPEQIEVIVHPQSIIHSMIQFEDGSIKAQMGIPDMKIPIQFALTYPTRLKSSFPRFNFSDYPQLTFEKPDYETFPSLQLAFDAMNKGGNMPCILNAANEIAVEKFLQDEIDFLAIPEIIEYTMSKSSFIKNPSYEDYVASNEEARQIAQSVKKKNIILS